MHKLIADLRRLHLSADASLAIDAAAIWIFFCCQCAFEVRISKDIFGIEDVEMEAYMPKDPFASQMRARVNADEDFKAEWMRIISTTWECMQYMEVEPQHAEFMELYPCQETWNWINAFVGSHEARKTELQARRVNVLRNLAHLHPVTAGRVGEARWEPRGQADHKRKLEQMSGLLACLQRMSYK